jgi:hypothetical protein
MPKRAYRRNLLRLGGHSGFFAFDRVLAAVFPF